MTGQSGMRPLELLLVDDNPGDVRLTMEALREGRVKNNINVAEDGVAAMEFLHGTGRFRNAPRPDLIILDLNMPRKDGREVLAEIKSCSNLQSIPVVILTTSGEEADVTNSYSLHANSYITKPVEFTDFIEAVRVIEEFWLGLARLPGRTPLD